MLGLAKCVKQAVPVVHRRVKLRLQFLLRHAHQEVADELRHGLSHGSNRDLEVGVDTRADFLNEDVSAAAGPRGDLLPSWLVSLWLILDWHAVLIVLRHVLLCGHNRGTVFLIVGIVDEHVVLFRVDDSLDMLTAIVSFALKDLNDNIHDFRA